MPTNNAWLSDTIRLCQESRIYVQLLQNSVFSNISAETTAAQFAAVEQSIRDHGERLAATLDPLHYSALTGTHQCVPEVTELACTYLANLLIMQPEPSPPTEPPARRSPQRSAEEVVNDVSSLADEVKLPGDTFLGEERRNDATPGESR